MMTSLAIHPGTPERAATARERSVAQVCMVRACPTFPRRLGVTLAMMMWLAPNVVAAQDAILTDLGESARSERVGLLTPEFLALPEFRPMLTSADFQFAKERLRFDDDAAAALFSAFYDEYRRSFDAALAQTHARMADIQRQRNAWRAENPDQPFQEPDLGWHATWEAWSARRAELEAQLTERIDAMLDSDRREWWRQIKRDVRLSTFVAEHPWHRIAWAFDPRVIFEAIGVEPDSTLKLSEAAQQWIDGYAEAVEAYRRAKVELDEWPIRPESQHLARRDPAINRKAWEDRHYRTLDLMYGIREAAGRIEPVMAALDPEQARRFQREVDSRRHPGIYTPSPIDMLSEQLGAIECPESIRATVEVILASALARQEQIRERMMRAVESYDAPTPRRARLKAMAEAADLAEIDALRARHAVEHPALPIWSEYRNHVHATCRQVRLAIPSDVLDGLPPAVRLLLLWTE